jgi:shikimate kinase
MQRRPAAGGTVFLEGDSQIMPRQGPNKRRPASLSGKIAPGNVVLVGLMGAGKSCIGRHLAQRLGLPFVDADAEIEKAAGCSISEIFEQHGEQAFREGERRVIARLLEDGPQILATGGGAFMDPETREAIARRATSVWLRADLDLLLRRTGRRNTRPLLRTGDPKEILGRLIDERYPTYAMADIVVDSVDAPPEVTVQRVLDALTAHRREEAAAG